MTTTQAPEALTDERLKGLIKLWVADHPSVEGSEYEGTYAQDIYLILLRALSLRTTGEAVAWQHRVFYDDTGLWSEWRDGKRNAWAANEYEERPLFAHPPAPQPEVKGIDRAEVQRAYDILCSGKPPHSARESNARRVLRSALVGGAA